MAISNRGRVAKGLETLRDGLVQFVERELAAHYGDDKWAQKTVETSRVRLEVGGDGAIQWDNHALLKVM